MPAQGRIPRTRHLFPEVAAVIIASRRAGLHSTRRIRRAIGVVPLWLISATAGVSSLGLTALLFFLSQPLPATAPQAQAAMQFSPRVESPPPVPEPVIPAFVPDPFPQPARTAGALLDADLAWTRLPDRFLLDRTLTLRERTLTSSEQAPVQTVSYNFLTGQDEWRTASFRESPSLAFQRYVPVRDGLNQVAPLLAADAALAAGSSGDLGMGVVVRKSVPAQVAGRSVFTYEIIIQNASREALDDVLVRERISAIDRVEQVSPPADVQQDELVWKLGPLGVGDLRVLRVTVNLDNRPEVLTETHVIPSSRLAAAVAVNLPPPRSIPARPAPPAVVREEPKFPRLELTYTPITSVKTGEVLSLRFTVKNVGNAAAEDVRLYVQLSGEFQHRFGDHIQNQVRRLEPGQAHSAQLRAVAKNPGDGKLEASLTMQGNKAEDRRLLIPVTGAAADIERSGPASSEALRPVPDLDEALAWRMAE